MLPRARIMLAATFVTAILVTVVGTTIVPVPADSYINAAALPRVEQPAAEYTQMTSPKEQSRMPAYARRDDQPHQTRPVESSSNAPKGMDGGTSIYAKTHTPENQVERAAPMAPEQPASNSDTKSADMVATSNASGASMATADPPTPHSGAVASVTAATNSAQSNCKLRNERMGFHGFRPAQYRLHDHHSRHRGWHRTWASRHVIAGSDARRGIPGSYSAF
jgi:hypothetical protein